MADEDEQNQGAGTSESGAGEAGADESGGEGIGGNKLVTFLLWLGFAIVTDILSLLPYVGVAASWPFAALFTIYKWMAGLNFKKTVFASVGDFLFEGLFSTLPANTLDVLVTYILSRAEKVVAKAGPAGELLTKAAAAKGVGGAKASGGMKTEATAASGDLYTTDSGEIRRKYDQGSARVNMDSGAGEAAREEIARGVGPEEFGLPPEERAPGVRAMPGEEAPKEEAKPGAAPEEGEEKRKKEAELAEAVGETPTPLEKLPQELGLKGEIPGAEEETGEESKEEEIKKQKMAEEERRKKAEGEERAKKEML